MFRTTVVAALTAGLIAAAHAQEPAAPKVKEGDPFPAVPLQAAQIEKAASGKAAADTLSIADLKGKTVVVFFYPKALTRGCTIESCGFRDAAEKFPKDTVIVGASADDKELQQKFIDEHKLPFALLCDTELKLIDALGIKSPRGNVAQRVTFVVDKDGKVAKVYTQVTPASHPGEVLKFVEGLK